MFKKLLSNLPFNPSLIGEVSFYARRMHREAAIRRTGLIFLSLALVLQVFAVASPPQQSLASSSSDLISGGFSSRDQAINYCNQNVRSYKKILAYYGISCSDVANTTVTKIAPHDYNDKLYSMGRLAYGVKGETPVTIPGVGTFYFRHFWSLNHNSSYTALKGKTKYGLTFFILYGCGNLVFINLPSPPQVCKYNPDILASSSKCFEPCPIDGKSGIPKTSSQCFEPCPYNASIAANSSRCFAPCKYDRTIAADSSQCFQPCPVSGKSGIPATSPDCFEPCQYNSTIAADSSDCKPCEESQSAADVTACISYHKTASNLTQQLKDANGTTAHAGDVIDYTLTTQNTGKATVKNYVVNENISDVLDYANVVDLHGGQIDDNNIVSWPKGDLKAGQTINNLITVKIKDPIPNTPMSATDEAHFDLTMTNVYGNTVNIKLPSNIVKTTEIVTTRLPNTGPGTSLMIAVSITIIIAYLFARSRLFAQELDLVRSEFAETGSY